MSGKTRRRRSARAMKWFPFFTDALLDERILSLSDRAFRFWVYLMCLLWSEPARSRNAVGIAIALGGRRPGDVNRFLDDLVAACLVERHGETVQLAGKWKPSRSKIRRAEAIDRDSSERPPDDDRAATERPPNGRRAVSARSPRGKSYICSHEVSCAAETCDESHDGVCAQNARPEEKRREEKREEDTLSSTQRLLPHTKALDACGEKQGGIQTEGNPSPVEAPRGEGMPGAAPNPEVDRESRGGNGAPGPETYAPPDRAPRRDWAPARSLGPREMPPFPDGGSPCEDGPFAPTKADARHLWHLLWDTWGNPELCRRYMDVRRRHDPRAWRWAVSHLVARGTVPGTMKYLIQVVEAWQGQSVPDEFQRPGEAETEARREKERLARIEAENRERQERWVKESNARRDALRGPRQETDVDVMERIRSGRPVDTQLKVVS